MDADTEKGRGVVLTKRRIPMSDPKIESARLPLSTLIRNVRELLRRNCEITQRAKLILMLNQKSESL